MIELVSEASAEAAWMSGVDRLLAVSGAEIRDLVVEISHPNNYQDPKHKHPLDPAIFGGDLLSNVANTIFPQKSWENSPGREDFYRRYLKGNARRRHGRWGRISSGW